MEPWWVGMTGDTRPWRPYEADPATWEAAKLLINSLATFDYERFYHFDGDRKIDRAAAELSGGVTTRYDGEETFVQFDVRSIVSGALFAMDMLVTRGMDLDEADPQQIIESLRQWINAA